ncbi:MAG: septum formation inhibitor Maf [Burkholderiales bacterium]|nr:septum formation inhibitor Maf [Burkholderiales bacterium]MDE2396855.1 septum formation inhibitor Maf [Burkholderiales bacterium]MDE2453556.1 septum formation inhibitor Maf [Burkholderiales bacterium]
MHRFIYLASQSPRRTQLLDQIGVAHEPLLAGPRENAERLEETRSGEAPVDYVLRVTRAKLHAARQRLALRGLAEAPILAADTTVALGRRILGKPADADDAAATLAALSGRTHHVLTAVAVSHGAQTLVALSDSKVRFGALSQGVIERYVASGEPFGKAGAYAVQGPISAWIEKIEGSYTGIMGLPLFETRELLGRARVRFGF